MTFSEGANGMIGTTSMMHPPREPLKIGSHLLPIHRRTLVMGILNVTPDSFSDGGRYNRLDRAVELFRQLLAETRGTPDEAVIREHLGRSYFASGNIAAAVESFTQALDLRVAGSADAALIYASTVAVQRARDELDRAS